MKRLAIVNAFYPPDLAFTGVSASRLVDQLRAAMPELEVSVFATDQAYRGGSVSVAHGHHVERIHASYRGANRLLRLIGSLWDGWRLARRACRAADMVIAMTDPPLLGLWVSLAARSRGVRWVEWTMDLFPEAFVAAGLVPADGALYRGLMFAVRHCLPERYLCLGPLQHEFLCASRQEDVPWFNLPCGSSAIEFAPPPEWKQPGKVTLAYVGNLGEAHSADVVAAIVRRADPARTHFVFAPYGAKRERLRELTRGCESITWRDHLPPAELAHADVHIVSLSGKWSHICVPSKAATAMGMGRPILFAGLAATDVWREFGTAGWLVPERAGGSYDSSDIDRALSAIARPGELAAKTAQAEILGRQLQSTEWLCRQRIAQGLEGVLTPASLPAGVDREGTAPAEAFQR